MEELKKMKETGKQREFADVIQSFLDLNSFLGVDYYNKLEQKYKI
jgi:hypothetical protein